MARLTYRDFQQRISIQDLLVDAGYHQNLKDGRTYPSYSKEKGDKFIVTRNGMACFRPPEQRCYNVISFIKTFPELFAEYRPGMDKDRLVNLVCNRILNQPLEQSGERACSGHSGHSDPVRDPFDIDQYETDYLIEGDRTSEMKFYPYFHNRGITLATARAFSDHFFLATKLNPNGRTFTNLAFPLSTPAWPGKYVLGLEERSKPNADGKCFYKGLAKNSDSANGVWIGRLCDGASTHGYKQAFAQTRDIFWFESAYDAMAFYQLHARESDPDGIDYRNAAYLSTSGTPSVSQIMGVVGFASNSRHHLCFDNDKAGRQFAVNFALIKAGHQFHSNVDTYGVLKLKDFTSNKGYMIPMEKMSFDEIVDSIGIADPNVIRHLPDEPYKDWNEQVMAGMKERETPKRFHR